MKKKENAKKERKKVKGRKEYNWWRKKERKKERSKDKVKEKINKK